MKYAITALIPLFLLTSCATASFDALYLPDVVEYTKEQQTKAADEIETNNIPTIIEMMKDYHIMRQQTKAARDV